MAKTFKDVHGNSWTIDVTALTVEKFESATGQSFFSGAASGEVKASSAWRVAYESVKDQAKAAGFKTFEEWIVGIGKGAVGVMSKAAFAEISEFFPEATGAEGKNSEEGQATA